MEETHEFRGKKRDILLPGKKKEVCAERGKLKNPPRRAGRIKGAERQRENNALPGYEKPKEGEVLLDGRPLGEYKGICPVQMIWQHPELAVDPLLRLKETMKEVEEPDLAERMESFGIREEWLERFPSELSGGELQRFCLARALGKEVRYLLCDEISAMLDLWNQARIFELLLRETDRRKLGILIVSHDEALLERVCTRVESLEGGS